MKEVFEKEFSCVADNYNSKRNEANKAKEALLATANRNERMRREIAELEGEYVDFIEIIDKE